jgi:hypothetical protein
MKLFFLKLFFPDYYERLVHFQETKDFILKHFGAYAPFSCGEGWSSTVRSEDPLEILQAFIARLTNKKRHE